ncbi:MAG: retropepsin-like aspartic protease [Nanoarchaeota archaeon]|nr:retropepsin-like aspartic protease [Nanoarchaeota archaeon]
MGKIEIDLKKPVIVLDVTIEGRFIETAKMALDTGASCVMIPWKLAKSLGLNPELSQEKIETITASGTEIVPVVILPAVSVLGCKAKEVRALVHDLPSKSYVDGLLGLSFLRNFNVKLQFKEGFLEIE